MSRELENKTALVTGGSRGIGAAIAKRLATSVIGARADLPRTRTAIRF
jgi:3-oxoacyl-[acyl-carrier protein] reductase